MKKLIKQINKIDKILILIFAVSVIFRLWDITTQFEVWDETTVVRYGEEYLNFIRNADFTKESWSLNKEHPPLSKYFYGSTRLVSLSVPYFSDVLDQEYPIGKRYTFQRIISIIISALTVCVTYLIVRKFYSRKVAFLASMMLSFTPYFIAHSKVATQENLVTFFITISVYLFILGLFKQNLKSKEFLLAGLTLGLALATKYNAIFYLLFFAVAAFFMFFNKFIKNPRTIIKNYIILIPFLSFAILFILWPWLWLGNPIEQFLISTGSRVGFSRIDKPATEYFLGEYPHNSPWYYFFVYFYATTPPVLLVGLLLFIAKNVFNLSEILIKKRDFGFNKNLTKFDLIILLFFLTPFLATFSPLKMDGIRYIFPVYVPLAISACLGYWFLISKLNTFANSKYIEVISASLYMAIIGSLIFLNVTLHPYYLDYYNFLVGGPKTVYEKRLFDFGYWGEGLRNAVNYLNSNAKPNTKVMVYAVPTHVLPEFRKDLTVIKYTPTDDVTYMILNPTGLWLLEVEQQRTPFSSDYEYDPIYEEKTYDEAPIVTIYEVDKKDDPGE